MSKNGLLKKKKKFTIYLWNSLNSISKLNRVIYYEEKNSYCICEKKIIPLTVMVVPMITIFCGK